MKLNDYLGKTVTIKIDRPYGSHHPDYLNLVYTLNYGFVPDTMGDDDEELDAYILGIMYPLTVFTGKCIAIIHRLDDRDDKLVIVPDNLSFSKLEIEQAVSFQEKYFIHEIITCVMGHGAIG